LPAVASSDGSDRGAGRPDESLDERVAVLLARLTLDEKLAMMHQHSPGVPRLNLPALTWGIAVRRGADPVPGATVFPQAIGLGATWDVDLVERVGSVIATEVHEHYERQPIVGLSIWGPVVNLLRDPRWGRNEEGYSECPVLTSALAVAMCRGLSGRADGVVRAPWRTTPVLQHFLGYNHERRGAGSANIRPRVLHEYELQVFRAPISAGVALGVMLAYSSVNGVPNHISPYINAVVRGWRADCTVVSDAWGPSFLVMDDRPRFDDRMHAYAAAVRAGLDLFVDQDGTSEIIVDNLRRAIHEGLLSEELVDGAVGRLLRTRLLWGGRDKCSESQAPAAPADRSAHRELAERAAAKAIVLLKNEQGLLPLNPTRIGRVAVVGPLANLLCRDWYSPHFDGGDPPVNAIAALVGGDRVSLVEGVDAIALRVLEGGGYVTAVAERDGGVLTVEDVDVVRSAQTFAVFEWGSEVVTLRAEANGRFVTSQADRTLANDAEEPNGWEVRQRLRLTPHANGWLLFDVSLGRYVSRGVDRVLRAAAPTADMATRFAREVLRDGAAAAAEAARAADVVIAIVGNHPLINGREGEDRSDINLPPQHDAVVTRVAASTTPVVAIVVSGYPVALGQIAASVPAILWSCHSGPTLSRALVGAIFGVEAPAGRLPQTWPRSADDLGDILDYDIIKSRKTYLYSNVYPQFPFGHGLTYSNFWYDLRLRRPILCVENMIELTADVGNIGPMDSDEVVQLYGRARSSRFPRPMRQLLAFQRVHVRVGEIAVVDFQIPVRELAIWSVESHDFVVEPGVYEIMLGRSATDIVATRLLTVRAPPLPARRMDIGPVRASDFDDYNGFVMEDDPHTGTTTMVAGPTGGWLSYSDVALAASDRLRVRASRSDPGWSVIEVRLGDPAGELIGLVPVVAGVGSDAIEIPLRVLGGRHDMYLVAMSAVRLTTLQLRRSTDR
jgi:beta-glucosidase